MTNHLPIQQQDGFGFWFLSHVTTIGQGLRPARPSAVYSVCRYCQIQIRTVVYSSLSIRFWISSRLVMFLISAMTSAL
jgi:hypothetical protein